MHCPVLTALQLSSPKRITPTEPTRTNAAAGEDEFGGFERELIDGGY